MTEQLVSIQLVHGWLWNSFHGDGKEAFLVRQVIPCRFGQQGIVHQGNDQIGLFQVVPVTRAQLVRDGDAVA